MSETRVIERCPDCGVEHESPGDGTCEACGTPLRAWCRTHSREIGWLDGSTCLRCVEEEAVRAARLRRYAIPVDRSAVPADRYAVPVELPGARPTPPAAPRPVAPRAAHRDAAGRRRVRAAPGPTGRQKTVRGVLLVLASLAGVGVLLWGDLLPRNVHALLVGPLVLGLTAVILYMLTQLVGTSGDSDG